MVQSSIYVFLTYLNLELFSVPYVCYITHRSFTHCCPTKCKGPMLGGQNFLQCKKSQGPTRLSDTVKKNLTTLGLKEFIKSCDNHPVLLAQKHGQFSWYITYFCCQKSTQVNYNLIPLSTNYLCQSYYVQVVHINVGLCKCSKSEKTVQHKFSFINTMKILYNAP